MVASVAAGPPSSSPRRAPNRWPPAVTGRRCCSTAGRLLGRQDLRAAEDTLRRWMAAAALVRRRADGGVVAVVAESAIPTVQALIRWDPVGHAEAELDARAEVGLPPAVHMAALDGSPAAVAALLDTAALPDARSARPGGAAAGRPQAAGHSGRRPGEPDAGPGARATAVWRSPRRCAGPPACSAHATISSRFACRSTRCT